MLTTPFSMVALANMSSLNVTESSFSTTTIATVAAGAAQSDDLLHTVLIYFVYPLLFILGFLGNLFVTIVLISSQFLYSDAPATANATATLSKLQHQTSISTAAGNDGGGGGNASIKCKSISTQSGSVNNGNSVVIKSAKSKFKRKPRSIKGNTAANGANMRDLNVTNFFLLNLSISDFFYIVTIPFLLTTMHYRKWLFSLVTCKIYYILIYFCQFSTVYILVILSIDRYLAVKYPFRMSNLRTIHIARLVIGISWFLAVLFIVPVIRYSTLDTDENKITWCVINWPESLFSHVERNETVASAGHLRNESQHQQSVEVAKQLNNMDEHYSSQTETASLQNSSMLELLNIYLTPFHLFQLYSLFLNYLLPVGTILILYMKILKILKKKSFFFVKKSKSKIKSHRKITRMVFIIIICYLFSWTPYWITHILSYLVFVLKYNGYEKLLFTLSHLVQVGAYLSSTLNPFIYSYMSEGFRTNFKLILTKCCPRLAATTETSPINKPKKSIDRQQSNRTTLRKEISAAGIYKMKKKNRQQQATNATNGASEDAIAEPPQSPVAKTNHSNSDSSLLTIVQDQNEVTEALIGGKDLDFIDNEGEETNNGAKPSEPQARGSKSIDITPTHSLPKAGTCLNRRNKPKSNLAIILHSIKLSKPSTDDRPRSPRNHSSPNRGFLSNEQTNGSPAALPDEIGLKNLAAEGDKDESNEVDVELQYKTYLLNSKSKYTIAFNFHPRLGKLFNYKHFKFFKNEIKKNQYSTTPCLSNTSTTSSAKTPQTVETAMPDTRPNANPIVSV